MPETINITNFKSDFIKKKLTITATEEPSSFDLRIVSKIVPNLNLLLRIGLDIGFIENGRVKVTKNDSQTIFDDNDISGLQEINTGDILMSNSDFTDIKIWNTDGGSFEIVVLVFINSTSDGTFVDPLALLEATSKTTDLLNEAKLSTNSPFTQTFSMLGYKGLILSMEAKVGLGESPSIISSGSWTTPENSLNRATDEVASRALGAGSDSFVIDYGEEITSDLSVFIRTVNGAGNTGTILLEYSTDNVIWNTSISETPAVSTRHLYGDSTSRTFRYLRFTSTRTAGAWSIEVYSIGKFGYLGQQCELKIQRTTDDINWSDFILSTEYDTEIDRFDKETISASINRSNPSNTSVVYTLPQGQNKLRIHCTLSDGAFTFTDHDTSSGYGGKITIERLN